MKYYSQNGEDSILWSLFREGHDGFFLDVGALDGTRFSNTYSFERAGWFGICVEAHPNYIEILRANRPKSKIVHAAAGEKDCDGVDFYANSRGSLSTLDPSLKSEFQGYGKYFTGWKTIQVPMMTLDTICDNINHIDLVSMDIEGCEWQALQGFDIDRFKPRILVTEIIRHGKEIVDYMRCHGYKLARVLSNNYFFCHQPRDIRIVSEAVIKTPLIHTTHPLDEE